MKRPAFDPTWPDDVKALYRHDVEEIWDSSLAPNVWNQYHNQLGLYIDLAGDEPIDVLDVGCAQGTLALLLAERGHRVTAVDLRAAFLDYARSRHEHGAIEFVSANVLTDDLPGKYDLVFANQIIEHLVYPTEFLRRLARTMRPGARLVVSTPNGHYLKNGLPSFGALGDIKRWEHMQFTADGDGHFFAYLESELVQIFEDAGFVRIKPTLFETPFVSGHMKLRYVHRVLPASWLRALDRCALRVPWLRHRFAHQLLVCAVLPE